MAATKEITLNYFDARGRAQLFRYYFVAHDLAFTDYRVPLSDDFHEWSAIRDDRSVTGPFKRLPVVVVDGHQVCETLTIANYLHALSGDAIRLSEEDNLRHGQLLSSLYCDMILHLGTVPWVDRMYPGVDLEGYLTFMLGRLKNYLTVLHESLDDWGWLAGLGKRPLTLADCMLWEGLDIVGVVLGPAVTLDAYPLLKVYYEDCPARSKFVGYIEAHPCPFTARPEEAGILAQVHQVVEKIVAEGSK